MKGSTPAMGFRRTAAVALAAIATTAVATSAASAAPMIMLYNTADANKTIIKPGTTSALPIDGRMFVVEPNGGHLFAGDADKPYRLDKVSSSTLVTLGTESKIAAYLKARLDRPCVFSWGSVDCRSYRVTVDEIGIKFAEAAPSTLTKSYVPRAREGQPGLELSQAMQILANTPHPKGGNYAQRVHFFLAPAVVSDLGAGRGGYHNLGRDGLPHFRSYVGLRRALGLSGGVWMEMYHHSSATGTYPFTTAEWQAYPWKVTQWMTGVGTAVVPSTTMTRKAHFLMTAGKPKLVGAYPTVCGSGSGQTCQFALARTTKNGPIFVNGVGSYRMDANASDFATHLRRHFFR